MKFEQASCAAAGLQKEALAAGKEREAALERKIQDISSELDEARGALKHAEMNEDRMAKGAAARNSEFNSVIKSRELEISALKGEQKRLQDLCTKSVDFQTTLQVQLDQEREHSHSDAFEKQRTSLFDAQQHIANLSAKVEALRAQVLKLSDDLLTENTIKEQLLSAHAIEHHTLMFECEQKRRTEGRLHGAEVEACRRRLKEEERKVRERDEALETSQRQQANLQLTLSEEIDLLKQRLIALGSRELLFQVSPAKDVLRMEEELDELRSENLNLKIHLGDLENARGFNDLREPLEIQQGYKGKRCCGERRGNTNISSIRAVNIWGAARSTRSDVDEDTTTCHGVDEKVEAPEWWKSFNQIAAVNQISPARSTRALRTQNDGKGAGGQRDRGNECMARVDAFEHGKGAGGQRDRGNECMARVDASSQLFETRIVQEHVDEENAWASSRSPNVYALESLAALSFDSVPPSLSASDFSVSPDTSPNVTYRCFPALSMLRKSAPLTFFAALILKTHTLARARAHTHTHTHTHTHEPLFQGKQP